MFIGRHFSSAAVVAAALGGTALPVATLLAATDKVQVEVTGTIKPYCASSATAVPINAGDPSKAGSSKYTFTVDCNAPFQYTMQSGNGAMRLVDAPAGAAREKIEVAYDVHIRIPLTHGGAIDDTCSSASIKQGATSCRFTDSGQKIAIDQRAETQISWEGARAQLIAGQYSDHLTVFVSVKL